MPKSDSEINKENACTREIVYRHNHKNSYIESSSNYSFFEFTNSSGSGSTVLEDKNVEQIINSLYNITSNIQHRTKKNMNKIKQSIRNISKTEVTNSTTLAIKNQQKQQKDKSQKNAQKIRYRGNVRYLNLKDIIRENQELTKEHFSFKRQNTVAQLDEAEENNQHFQIDQNLNFIRNSRVEYDQVPTFLSNQFEIDFGKNNSSESVRQINCWYNKNDNQHTKIDSKTQRKLSNNKINKKLSGGLTQRHAISQAPSHNNAPLTDRKVIKKKNHLGIYQEILSLYSTAKLLAMNNR